MIDRGPGVKLATFSKICVMVLSGLIASNSFAISAEKEAAIAERIKPVGDICLEGDSSCAGAVAVVSDEPRSAEDIYNKTCTGCHSTGAAGAPKTGNASEWGPRKAKGLETLYTHALNGFNGMPPKGLCMDCSDDELKSTVDFILSKIK